MPKISVIVPTYNRAQLLGRAIRACSTRATRTLRLGVFEQYQKTHKGTFCFALFGASRGRKKPTVDVEEYGQRLFFPKASWLLGNL